ncbi:uncharacterized protein N7483_007526 [Penicillium malachiteum]|uniref:uncharacterized protein n=1 Tax=Penicillium malachiteum TaxID=1324776 RepID=UPI002547128F|nr:uncharacterized protein N7483_007526 [Penicillium malachiteum]KAJ5726169.1 hypothetical protein N7483_007526 [Penicillium malachiteum]
MSFDPQTFYHQRAEIITALDTLRTIMIRFLKLVGTQEVTPQDPFDDPNLGKLIDNIQSQIINLVPPPKDPTAKDSNDAPTKEPYQHISGFLK